ncbi:ArsR/SmtB family transcription factor [Marinospirillum insulare]|uniref:Transcriptional regulator n=1 Tax=Marinospirillum insulare TaxID=217169 RepID=A0ABQ6A1A1_9GAMM|nr:metalloregulator ArsR/SmtB family transcription factor [Marinospirillum insulare]GLR64327.1 transcriptional regulator [Marinospirillum insulare]
MATTAKAKQETQSEFIDDLRNNAKQATTLLKALANESRLLILCYLDDRELSVSELNACLDLSQSALSQHLAVLRRDQLVKTRRESQTIYYSLNGEEAKQIIRTLHNMYCNV